MTLWFDRSPLVPAYNDVLQTYRDVRPKSVGLALPSVSPSMFGKTVPALRWGV